MNINCTRRIQFCSGHRVMGHESKCAHLHGHNYVVEITATAELDSIGRVIDFSVLKERVGGWIETNWDHGFVLHEHDRTGMAAMSCFSDEMSLGNKAFTQKLYLMPMNPTAENMADYLLNIVCPKVLDGLGIVVTKVVVHETENCKAEATL